MQSIHIRPPEVEDRLIPGHWEGDLIKGAGNRSSDLSIYSQDELDAIALELNQRPRARFGFASPLAVYTSHMEQPNNPAIAVH
jgi:IS30 family transposase